MTLRRVDWSPEFQRLLIDGLRDDDRYERVGDLSRDPECLAYGVFHGGDLVAAVVFSGKVTGSGEELSIDAYAGDLPGADLTQTLLEGAEALAKALGFAGVRFETRRMGLARKALRRGYALDNLILRREVAGAVL